MADKKKPEHLSDDEHAAISDGAPPNEPPQSSNAVVADKKVDELEQLRRQAIEAQDRYLRSQAELDNTRKRLRREMDEERRYAELPLLADLLPVMDNINRAIEAAEKSADPASLLSGFKMVSQQLNCILERHHCKPIAAQGEPFDPARHQAIMQQPSEEHPENTILNVGQTGYLLHDRIVRPAQVVVSKKSN